MSELGSCLGLNFLRDPRYYAVEQVDVVIGIVVRAGEKEVGDAAKDIRLLVGRSRCEGPPISAIIDRSSSTASGVPGLRKSG
jgi:hypothetical protein